MTKLQKNSRKFLFFSSHIRKARKRYAQQETITLI